MDHHKVIRKENFLVIELCFKADELEEEELIQGNEETVNIRLKLSLSRRGSEYFAEL